MTKLNALVKRIVFDDMNTNGVKALFGAFKISGKVSLLSNASGAGHGPYKIPPPCTSRKNVMFRRVLLSTVSAQIASVISPVDRSSSPSYGLSAGLNPSVSDTSDSLHYCSPKFGSSSILRRGFILMEG